MSLRETTARDVHLGWEELQHKPACTRRTWEVDFRVARDELRDVAGPHQCTNEDCEHTGRRTSTTTVRILCRGCAVVHQLTAVDAEYLRQRDVADIGYGSTPRRCGPLYLHPGPVISYLSGGEPWEWLVTTDRGRVTADTVVGIVASRRGQRGGVLYEAAAGLLNRPTLHGALVGPLEWQARSTDTFRTPAAAAKWIAANIPGQSVSDQVSEEVK